MACSLGPGSLVKGLLRRKRSYASGLFGCVAGPLVSARGAQRRKAAPGARVASICSESETRFAAGVVVVSRQTMRSPSVSTTSIDTRSRSPSFWNWPVRTRAALSSRPAVFASTFFPAYLRVDEKGRTASPGA